MLSVFGDFIDISLKILSFCGSVDEDSGLLRIKMWLQVANQCLGETVLIHNSSCLPANVGSIPENLLFTKNDIYCPKVGNFKSVGTMWLMARFNLLGGDVWMLHHYSSHYHN